MFLIFFTIIRAGQTGTCHTSDKMQTSLTTG